MDALLGLDREIAPVRLVELSAVTPKNPECTSMYVAMDPPAVPAVRPVDRHRFEAGRGDVIGRTTDDR